MQALVVRNACFEFTKELEVAFEIILADFVRRQDELFLATMDEIDLVAFRKKPWPLDSSVPAQLAEQKKEMKQRVKEWAQQAADHEKSVSFVLECYRREAYVVIGQLTLVYGVSPREGKKKR